MNARIKHWLHGLLSAFIGGGATALTTQAGLATAQGAGLEVHTLDLKSLGIVALSAGIYTAAAYLKQSPLPPESSGNTEFSSKPTAETKP